MSKICDMIGVCVECSVGVAICVEVELCQVSTVFPVVFEHAKNEHTGCRGTGAHKASYVTLCLTRFMLLRFCP